MWTSSMTYTLKSPAARCVHRILQELAHLVDLGVGGRIDFYQVDEATRVDFHAAEHFPQGLELMPVSQLRHFARIRARSSCPRRGFRKQVRVMQALLIQRVAQRLDHVLLPDQRLERARTPLAGENLVRHDGFL